MLPNEAEKQLDIFEGGRPCALVTQPMARASDPKTSHEAAEVVRPHLSKLQKDVLELFRDCGPMTAKFAETSAAFADYSPSTVRKRISELAKGGFLVEDGIDRTGRAPSIIYKIPG